MRANFSKFWSDDGGATAIEYGLIASLVVIAAMGGIQALGGGSGGLWGNFTAHVVAVTPVA